MTDLKKWFDKRYSEGAYSTLEFQLESEIQRFWAEHKEIEDKTEAHLDIRLRDFEGAWSLQIGDRQGDTDHRGRWAYGSILWESSAEGVALKLISDLWEESSPIEDWANIDIPSVEESLDGRAYVIYIRTGQSCPELEVEPLEVWNEEDLLYDEDSEEEDFRVHPQHHIEEPRASLRMALATYREYLKVQRLSYLLEKD